MSAAEVEILSVVWWINLKMGRGARKFYFVCEIKVGKKCVDEMAKRALHTHMRSYSEHRARSNTRRSSGGAGVRTLEELVVGCACAAIDSAEWSGNGIEGELWIWWGKHKQTISGREKKFE